jgi:hypothetical protein
MLANLLISERLRGQVKSKWGLVSMAYAVEEAESVMHRFLKWSTAHVRFRRRSEHH